MATPNVGLTYDGANNRTQMTDGGSAAVNYVYDDLNRLTDVHRGTSTDPFTYTYTYTPVGDLSSVTERVTNSPLVNQTISYAYFADRSLCWVYGGSSPNAYSSPPTGSATTTYPYDPKADLTLKTLPKAAGLIPRRRQRTAWPKASRSTR